MLKNALLHEMMIQKSMEEAKKPTMEKAIVNVAEVVAKVKLEVEEESVEHARKMASKVALGLSECYEHIMLAAEQSFANEV